MFKATGYDPNGIRRVWVEERSRLRASDACWIEVWGYIREHPDTKPFSRWRIEVKEEET